MKNPLLSLYTYIFSRPLFRKYNEIVVKIGLKGLGFLYSHDPESNGELFFLRKIILEFKVRSIFDVGANQGNYTKECLDLGFKGSIHCFEPHPKTYGNLKNSLANLPVTIHNVGFSDVEGTADIFDHRTGDGSEHASLFEGVIQSIHKDDTVRHEIVLKTLDSFLESSNIEHVGLLKIDTEGNEYNILLGAKNALKSNKIDIIHLEFNEMNTISRVFMKDFVELLTNYNLYRLLPHGFLEIRYGTPLLNEIFSYQNIVAVRKGINF